MTEPVFDFDAGLAAKAEGQAKVIAGARTSEWVAKAYQIIEALALSDRTTITSDDVHELATIALDPFPPGTQLGAAFTRAHRAGLIERTNTTRLTKRKAGHARAIAIWRVVR